MAYPMTVTDQMAHRDSLPHLFAADLLGRRGAVCIEHRGAEYLLTRSPDRNELMLVRVEEEAMP